MGVTYKLIETPVYEMSSFVEMKILKFVVKQAEKAIAYNQRKMSRVFPKGTRGYKFYWEKSEKFLVNSSNYDPMPAWTIGCQLGNHGNNRNFITFS